MFFSKKKKQDTSITNNVTEEKKPSLDIIQLIKELINAFEQEKNEIIQKALSIKNFYNDEWDAYLDTWGIEKPSSITREEALNTGAGFTHGALPMEVREVFIALKEKYEENTEDLREAHKQELFDNDEAEELLWNFEHRTLEEFVKVSTSQYIKKVKTPISSSTNNIFNNATKNENKWSNNLNDAKSYMIRCKNCGAARLHTDQYDKCKFCGSELFEKVEQ